MKNVLWLGLFVFAYGMQPAVADTDFNRQEVIRAGEKLAEEVEHLDEELHLVNAPTHVIGKIHHFEETVIEFVDEARHGASYQILLDEMNHIRADVKEIRDEFYAHPYLLNYSAVYTEYSAMRRAYRWLDHAMFMNHWNAGAWSAEGGVEAEMAAEMEADKLFLEQHAAEREAQN